MSLKEKIDETESASLYNNPHQAKQESKETLLNYCLHKSFLVAA